MQNSFDWFLIQIQITYIRRCALLNKHEDHIATCLCCRNLYFYLGLSGYGQAHGNPASVKCEEKHFNFDDSSLPMEAILALHDLARECADFEPRTD